MDKYFDIDRNKKILLYGDNYIAESIKKNIFAQKYLFAGIVDRKYVKSDYINGILYCDLNHLKQIECKNEYVIILCLSNGMLHEKIAEEICNIGFSNIVYLPMNNVYSSEVSSILRKTYRNICNGFSGKICGIPKTLSLNVKNEIIYKDDCTVEFFCYYDLLYSGDTKHIQKYVLPGREEMVEGFLQFADKPLKYMKSYIELFDYLSGNESVYPELYLKLQRENESDRIQLLEDRKELYKMYEMHFMYGDTFFMDSPVCVEWNEKGYFNVIDGLHRCFYLAQKGKKYIPVITNINSYQAYVEFKRYKEKENETI